MKAVYLVTNLCDIHNIRPQKKNFLISGMAGRLRDDQSLEFHRKTVLGDKKKEKEKKALLADVRWMLLCCMSSCLEPEVAGLQMRARFCLVYHGYCCRAIFHPQITTLPHTCTAACTHTQCGRRC